MDETASPPPEGRIRVERRGAVMLIGVDRPAKLNGFTPEMFAQLSQAFQRFQDDADARVAVLHAFGPHFSAGLQLDLFEERFRSGRSLSIEGLVDPFQLRPPFRTKPCVAAMQGICFTVACELMFAADVVVAASDCRFAQLEVKRGIMANHGATLRMAQRAGWGDAMLYLLTGDEFGAETAFRMRLCRRSSSRAASSNGRSKSRSGSPPRGRWRLAPLSPMRACCLRRVSRQRRPSSDPFRRAC
jgi:enoyl-CoA hydratase/carnithine racemase